jgi:hypothetical protein
LNTVYDNAVYGEDGNILTRKQIRRLLANNPQLEANKLMRAWEKAKAYAYVDKEIDVYVYAGGVYAFLPAKERGEE